MRGQGSVPAQSTANKGRADKIICCRSRRICFGLIILDSHSISCEIPLNHCKPFVSFTRYKEDPTETLMEPLICRSMVLS